MFLFYLIAFYTSSLPLHFSPLNDVSRHEFCREEDIFQLYVLWIFWIFSVVFFTILRECTDIISSIFFFSFWFCFLSLLLWNPNYIDVQLSDVLKYKVFSSLFCFLFIYFIYFNLGHFYWPVFKFTDSLFDCFNQMTLLKPFFNCVTVFFISSVSTWLLLMVSIHMLNLRICAQSETFLWEPLWD